MAELVLENISKAYGDFLAVKHMNLSVGKGEFVTLLGPSGCGKSTTLQMIAGLEKPTDGDIAFQGRTISSTGRNVFIEPEQRGFGVVFQSYALWPHMTVRQNLAFPLKVRRIARAERERRIEEALALVGLSGLGERYPGQLSGGQQQRVGLARAVVYRPALLLLDEPLSNLDALLREEARIWLKDIQMRLGITTIYVTHDQTEALSLSDRIIVMRDGLILQNGAPDEIYNLPASPFVAEFVGSANFLPGRVAAIADGRLSIDLEDGQRVRVRTPGRHEVGEPVSLAIRPERLRAASSIGDNVLNASLRRNIYVGERFCYEIEAGGRIVQAYGSERLEAGKTSLSFTEDAATVFSGTHQPGSAASATILAQGLN